MAINFNLKAGGCSPQNTCLDKFGCPDYCPDFIIRRHDTKPFLKISVEDCDGPVNFSGLVVEANMWAIAKLKTEIDDDDEYFRLADDIGFEQIMIGDIIVMDRVRLPERMLVVAFDEANKLVKVQRGYHGTEATTWKKGSKLRVFRILNGIGQAEMVFSDVQNVDGTVDRDTLTEAYLVYEWQAEDTCLPGCYWFEFKVLKMIGFVWFLPGGHWTGEIHTYTDGFYYTGSIHTESSVKLSFDQLTEHYLLQDTVWGGDIVLHTDDSYYTGLVHDDGSVFLNKTGIPSSSDTAYNEDGTALLSNVSIIPSFTDESLTPEDFGCTLGEGVESVRRYPTSGEGFLIKIEPSFSTEI